ncbi:MAG: Uma2 family endonuclease [Acidobacteriota bacterium]|nr:Uma2 family endonuclease [Acidobacteriota bacterium]
MALPQALLQITVEEYLAGERQAEERHEYLDGFIYKMAGESQEHGIISQNLSGQLYLQLRGKSPCQTFIKDTKVRCGPLPQAPYSTKGLFAYPDLVVVCGERRYLDQYRDVLLNPTVIIEVLSETTKDYDRGEKFERYRTWVPTLSEYVVVHQTQPRIEHHQRQPTGQWLLTTIDGLESVLPLPALACSLALQDIYEGIEFPVPPENADQ